MLSHIATCLFVLFHCISATIEGGNDPTQTLQLLRDIEPNKLSFKLSFQWPKGYCRTKSSGCEKIATGLPEYFTLHGLWPIYRGKCTDSNEVFSLEVFNDAEKNRLATYSPDLKKYGKAIETYTKFWTHEWNDHGKRCALYNVHDYFIHSLDLLDGSGVLTTIIDAGKPTTVEGMKAAFSGKEPYVRCKEGNDGVYYFYQLEFCLDSIQTYYNCDYQGMKDKTLCQAGRQFSYGDSTNGLFEQTHFDSLVM